MSKAIILAYTIINITCLLAVRVLKIHIRYSLNEMKINNLIMTIF